MGFDKVLITGCFGLVGSEAVKYFARISNLVIGIDANLRKAWFGDGVNTENVEKELFSLPNFRFRNSNIAFFDSIYGVVDAFKPQLVIHCAGQPSHEKSGEMPYGDFLNNTLGTANLLHCVHRMAPDATFIFVSTNKVYGDHPNKLTLTESEFRFDLPDKKGIDETLSIDQCTHSPFGANKTSADLMVQEYGRYFGMKTVCFRCGCITGKAHQGVSQHGFLSYLCRTAKQGGTYTIYGHKGKQVRDNLHAFDLANAFYFFAENPRRGEVYNMGGGYWNSCSVNEAIQAVEYRLHRKVLIEHGPERMGDHLCYYSDTSKFQMHYPHWHLTRNVHQIFDELAS